MKTRDLLSIGEVLKELEADFPDITISKIRFLESEGLIDPQRTPSGYRKFSRQDIARLRYILTLQRDRFMPLKIIRKQLEYFDPDAPNGTEPSAEQAAAETGGAAAAAAPSSTAAPSPPAADDDLPLSLEGGLQLSLDQLVAAGGLEEDRVRELEEYGLIDPHYLNDGDVYYDEDDLLVVKSARDLSKFGLEPRHLRMYRTFADKEAGLFENILLPLMRGGGDSKRQTLSALNELIKLSRRLKEVQLRANLRRFVSG